MADRNAPGVSSPHRSSSSAAPLAGTTGSGSVRSRNRRPPNQSGSENIVGNHGGSEQRTQSAKGREGTHNETSGLGQVLGDSWAQSWSSVQGFATSLLSVAENPSDIPQPRSGIQSDQSFASSLWNRLPPSVGGTASKNLRQADSPVLQSQRAANRVAAGSSDQREAALKTAQRASVLENSQDPSGGLDILGKYKRRNSDEITSDNSQPEEYLVYIHKILPIDTYAGIILRYKCMEDAFRKANGLWSRDSIQVRKWVILPVDACEVRGRPCEPPSSNQKPSAPDFFETSLPTGSMAPQSTSSGHSQLFSERAAQEDENAEKEIMPWSHVRWVKIDSLPDPVEIGRIARQKMGYFPPRRKKAVSFSSTPRQSIDAAEQIEQPMPRRQSSVGDGPPSLGRRESFLSHGDGDGPDTRPAWMRRSGGVGSLSRNIRAPGPDKDYLNSWAKKHFPGLNIDDLPSMSVMGSEMARFGFDREAAGIVEGAIQEGGDADSLYNQNTGLDKAAAAVETWLRTAWSKRSMAPLIPRQRNTAGQDFGDLIELTPTPGAEGTPRLDMFDSQIPSPFLGSKADADSSIKRSG
ncbi:carbohydrate-binding module family 50 protein [Trichoderma chlorosporum]